MPQFLIDARARVIAATKEAGIPFLNQVNERNVEAMIDEGVRIGAGAGPEVSDPGPTLHPPADAMVAVDT